MNKLKVEYVSTESIAPYDKNAKIHDANQIEQIKRSILDFGFNDPIGVWHDTIVEGHGRLIAAQELGIETVPIIRLDELTDEQRKAYALVHNKLTMNTDFDPDLLEIELEELALEDIDMSVYGFEMAEDDSIPETSNVERETLASRFLVPPFSVITAAKGEWMARKKAWIEKGIKSELGRGGTCVSASRLDGETVTDD